MELKKDYTVVIVTRNMQQAVRISDRPLFFPLGDLIECGGNEWLFARPEDKRIGDHATNLAEWVIYAVTGEQKSEERDA